MSDLLGFIPEPLTIPIERILPSRKAPEGIQHSAKFKQIVASIETIGLIEPLSVGKVDKRNGLHLLLDGHIRLLALKELEFVDAPCLVATDDESYTYNNRLNRVSTIQTHVMIRRALERGVPREKLAKALNVDVRHIVTQARLLNGVCPEAAELLKDHHFSPILGTVLRKLKPTRQIECVELMIATNNVTVAYAQALLAATPSNLLVCESKSRKLGGVTAEQMAKMEREMGNLQGQVKMVEQSYGQDVLNLVLAKGYLTKLLSNDAVFRFLSQHYPDVLHEFETLTQTLSLET
ncbi:plasmid partitioning protein RepB C-terminal domain-containing protein [Ralstonia solanacearum]|uniref:plasmid partitioning protein RepB C-terminal domain-containing protein n=1 Tax=Ralstonia solanacearum TaxID=305 RepID=UPI002029B958|nr:plasmid partitioning protein RepB C-terminal domain-containing protein [Ralstonia solanacearum]MCL9845848.1 ParB N-terminal domain-containing protein [Ralstonia solanacearum]MDC6256510.1 plasmid partitioning protein RepB C-terminal domain-containing protein [Ralstonia solanacearum]MDC6261197.1 plasmid partitioning protein RepB C-terminal domain-containing protein [Ralstonia solanacearum]MDC6305874.1 plasmid partitioning protein RepB C-terminal domain-containing protein [Ralstonia solanacearu